jgi:cardiolipin synthase
MKLLVQPDDGWVPLMEAVTSAKARIDLLVFRFDAPAFERALAAAIERGVVVRALVAHTNKHGEKTLRALEDRLLALGATIDRTSDALVRYHGKLLLIDRRRAFVLGFNFTRVDVEKSRSFGVVVQGRTVVQDVGRLIEADANRRELAPAVPSLVISPENARAQLARFISHAREELLVYDPKISDPAMIALLSARVRAGVRVRILGKLKEPPKGGDMRVESFPGKRLHVRAIIRDRRCGFIGSQSLRAIELDARREVGIIVRDRALVRRLVTTFEADWALTSGGSIAPDSPDEDVRAYGT